MKSFDQPGVQSEVYARLAKLEPTSPRQWGKMTPHQAIMHLTDSLHAVTGQRDMDIAAFPRPVQAFQRWFALWVAVPWPKGVQTAPSNDQELQGSKPVEFERDRALLLELARRVAAGQERFLESHPFFGRMSSKDWHRWVYLHFDHHLRQFGV